MSSALDEFKKPIEDWAGALVDGKPMENLLILYKLLYALGCRIDGIDFEIDRLCVAAIKKAKQSRNPHEGQSLYILLTISVFV
jgi:hypothetical protein